MPRKEMTLQDTQSLSNIVARLDATSGQLRALIEMMKQRRIEQLDIAGFKSLIRGMRWVEDFGHNATSAFYDELKNRGEYEAKAVPGGAKK